VKNLVKFVKNLIFYEMELFTKANCICKDAGHLNICYIYIKRDELFFWGNLLKIKVDNQ